MWPRDKAAWAEALCRRLSVPARRLAAVGDSMGDLDILQNAAHRVFVGDSLPSGLAEVYHAPRADLLTVAQWILQRLDAKV